MLMAEISLDVPYAAPGDPDPLDRPHCELCRVELDAAGTPSRPFWRCAQCGAVRLS
jgi:hypothetical protein